MMAAFLNRLNRWSELTNNEMDLFPPPESRKIEIDKGRDPFGGLDPTQWTMIVVDAWISYYKDMPSGRRVIVELLVPGDVHRSSNHYDYSLQGVVLAAGTVIMVPNASMDDLMSHPKIGESLDWIDKVRDSVRSEWLVNLAGRKAMPRLAHLLCELSARLNTAGLWHDQSGAMPLTQADLANALSMSSVHLNVALQQLRLAASVDISGGRLMIRDRSQLEAIADFNDEYLLRWPTRLPDRRRGRGHAIPSVERRSLSARRGREQS